MLKRQGGLYFWRIGRLGGSFYLAKPKRTSREQRMARYRYQNWGLYVLGGMGSVAALWFLVMVSIFLS